MIRRPLHTLACLVVLAAGCAAPEPRNLSLAKQEVDRYAESGRYQTDLASVGTKAAAWIAHRSAAGGKLAIVLDIDETSLSNLRHMREQDWGYHQQRWSEWVAEADAPAIEPVRTVYQTARAHGVTVFFLTGRRESERAATARNLRRMGFDGWQGLIVKANGSKDSAASFKLAARQRIAAQGYTIIANLGDQDSDFTGGLSERDFKLPNPFYRID